MSTIRSRIRSLSILLLALAAPLLQGQTSADTMLTLFNGTSLLGWTHDGSWEPASGVLTTTGDGNRSILTAVPFADVSLQFDYNVDSNINTAVRLCASRENKGGFRITLDNSYSPWGVGGIEQLSHSATLPYQAQASSHR